MADDIPRLAHRPSFDAEGRIVVWSAVIDDRMWLYEGGERKAGPFDCVCSPSVSARGGRVAFAGIREGRRGHDAPPRGSPRTK